MGIVNKECAGELMQLLLRCGGENLVNVSDEVQVNKQVNVMGVDGDLKRIICLLRMEGKLARDSMGVRRDYNGIR